ncbi:DUF4331 domain-containing protein [Flavobacterium amniphilum]|uniref:DUF4331 family protein n=1 Tax=Flavobacterium amniphilum TaxID=1834035 RepID=UPI00202A3C10|nr:DUF4331 family protein [Flavobacterium amniphilum]MCL9806297.1 DUF4331 domain-containing protein [Flavobacterium amniphilum]
MKKIKLYIGLTIFTVSGLLLIAADHADAPAVTGNASDITDVYAFQGQDTNNMVFVVNSQGLLSPGATASATFNTSVLMEINIDNNNDNVEDLVIQAIRRGNKMYFFGPTAPGATGTSSTIKSNYEAGSVEISQYGQAPIIKTSNGMKFFAGPRDDPFFFDLNQFKAILAGTASAFNNPGTDTFAGTNVLSTIIEVPKTSLGASSSINVWVESKQKM